MSTWFYTRSVVCTAIGSVTFTSPSSPFLLSLFSLPDVFLSDADCRSPPLRRTSSAITGSDTGGLVLAVDVAHAVLPRNLRPSCMGCECGAAISEQGVSRQESGTKQDQCGA
jgi:hypothetical protein